MHCIYQNITNVYGYGTAPSDSLICVINNVKSLTLLIHQYSIKPFVFFLSSLKQSTLHKL